jgi:endonuclease/exonuclease/phosphatase family metal-dependent hydrolase
MSMDATRTIRVATWNVHSCVGTDRRHDPARTAAVISELDADVVALQEFQYPADIALETRTPVVLETLDRYECALGPTLTRLTHSFGNVLLTRHAIRDLRRLDLSHERREPRGALAATIDVHGADLHVVATHLGLRPSERRLQVRRIMEHIETLPSGFLVVLGDFNDWLPGRSLVRALDARFGKPPSPPSFPAAWPVLTLDRIWVHPLATLRTLAVHRSPLARRASDHLPVVAEIDVALRVAGHRHDVRDSVRDPASPAMIRAHGASSPPD